MADPFDDSIPGHTIQPWRDLLEVMELAHHDNIDPIVRISDDRDRAIQLMHLQAWMIRGYVEVGMHTPMDFWLRQLRNRIALMEAGLN